VTSAFGLCSLQSARSHSGSLWSARRWRSPSSLEVENVQHHPAPHIQKYEMPADDRVPAIGRWGRQALLEYHGNRLNPVSQARREYPAHSELPFQSGRQLVAFGEAGRQVLAIFLIVSPHFFTVVFGVTMSFVIVAIVPAPVTVVLRHNHDAGESD